MGSYSNTWTTPGNYSITLPYGVSISTAYCWAGGGRGGKVSASQGRLGGGGGGSFAKPSNSGAYDNQTGAVVDITVGAGGSDSGVNGGNSKIVITIAGGSPVTWVEAGGGGGVSDNSTAAGTAGTVITGTGNAGGAGAAGTGTYSGGAGGGGGSSNAGTSATGPSGGAGGSVGGGAGGNGLISNNKGNDGTAAGGGGSGAYNIGSNSTVAAGLGADGQVQIEFTWPDNVLLNQITPFYSTVVSSTKTFNLTVLLEGLYAGSGAMNKCQGDTGDQFPGTTAEQITVKLRDSSTYALIFTWNNVNLSTSGQATMSLPSSYSGSYYIDIVTRNHIETSSASPVSFAGSTINYSFVTAASQAYGDNQQALSGGYYGLFAGDVNQDGLVDSTDTSLIQDDADNFVTGYVVTDINGDGVVDSTDTSIADANSNNFVATILPW